MTKENIKYILSTVKQGDLLEFVTDNEHLFFDCAYDSFPVIYDDERELFVVFKQNDSPYHQHNCPITINYVEYETLQQLYVHHKTMNAYEIFKKYKNTLTKEQSERMEQMILKTNVSIPSVKGYSVNLEDCGKR